MYADSSLTLVLNGAEGRLHIICGHDAELLFAQEWSTPRHGMQVLIPALMDALSRKDISLDHIGRIAIIRGPGSFTGLRLVLSTALGLARPLNLSMAGIGYLDALAADTAALCPGHHIWAITHARRGLVHIQGFAGISAIGLPIPVCEPQSASLEEAAARITSASGQHILLGSGARKNIDFFAEHIPGAVILPARFDHPAPETLLFLAQHASYSLEPVEPLYIRPCDAEENLDAIAAAKGLDPAAARARLAKLTQD